MKNLKTPARMPRKAPSNQTGGTAWGKKLAAEFSRMAQAADMKKLILLNFPYIIAFYMVEKAAWLYRHCNGDSVVDKLMVLFMNFGLAYKSVLLSFHPFDLMVGLVGAAVLKAVIYFKGKNAKKYRQGEEYGSARWGNQKDIEPFIDPVFENNVILTQTERLMMSGRPKHPKYARNKNVIVIGGSGSGRLFGKCADTHGDGKGQHQGCGNGLTAQHGIQNLHKKYTSCTMDEKPPVL